MSDAMVILLPGTSRPGSGNELRVAGPWRKPISIGREPRARASFQPGPRLLRHESEGAPVIKGAIPPSRTKAPASQDRGNPA